MSDRKPKSHNDEPNAPSRETRASQACVPINRRELFCRFLVTVTAIVGFESLAMAKSVTTLDNVPLHNDERWHSDKPHQDNSPHTDHTNHTDQNPHTDVGSGALHVDTNHVDIPTPIGHSDSHSDHTDGHTDNHNHTDIGHTDSYPHTDSNPTPYSNPTPSRSQ